MGLLASVQGLLLVAALSFCLSALVISSVVNLTYTGQEEQVAQLLAEQQNIATQIAVTFQDIAEVNVTLTEITTEDISIFLNDTQLIADMNTFFDTLNTSALKTFNSLHTGPQVVLTGSNSITVSPTLDIESTIDTTSVQAQLVSIAGDLVSIDAAVAVLNSQIIKEIIIGSSNVSGNVIHIVGQCGVDVQLVGNNVVELSACNVSQYPAQVQQNITNTEANVETVAQTSTQITNNLTTIETTLSLLQLPGIVTFNGINASNVDIVSSDNVNISGAYQFNVERVIQSVNGVAGGPNLTITGAGANVVVSTTPAQTLTISSTAVGYSTCVQNTATWGALTATGIFPQLNQWVPFLLSDPYFPICQNTPTNNPFTDNCGLPGCQGGWALAGNSGLAFGAYPTFIVPQGHYVWRLSLTVLTLNNQQGASHVGDFSTRSYGLSTDASCSTGIAFYFSMTMMAYDNNGAAALRSYVYSGDLTIYTWLPGWAPGTQYYLCWTNSGEGYPGTSVYAAFPELTRII